MTYHPEISATFPTLTHSPLRCNTMERELLNAPVPLASGILTDPDLDLVTPMPVCQGPIAAFPPIPIAARSIRMEDISRHHPFYEAFRQLFIQGIRVYVPLTFPLGTTWKDVLDATCCAEGCSIDALPAQ